MSSATASCQGLGVELAPRKGWHTGRWEVKSLEPEWTRLREASCLRQLSEKQQNFAASPGRLPNRVVAERRVKRASRRNAGGSAAPPSRPRERARTPNRPVTGAGTTRYAQTNASAFPPRAGNLGLQRKVPAGSGSARDPSASRLTGEVTPQGPASAASSPLGVQPELRSSVSMRTLHFTRFRQFAPLRQGTRATEQTCRRQARVSIRTPTAGARRTLDRISYPQLPFQSAPLREKRAGVEPWSFNHPHLFQSAPLREGRASGGAWAITVGRVSIRAPAGGARGSL